MASAGLAASVDACEPTRLFSVHLQLESCRGTGNERPESDACSIELSIVGVAHVLFEGSVGVD